jgi:hypothetical protein
MTPHLHHSSRSKPRRIPTPGPSPATRARIAAKPRGFRSVRTGRSSRRGTGGGVRFSVTREDLITTQRGWVAALTSARTTSSRPASPPLPAAVALGSSAIAGLERCAACGSVQEAQGCGARDGPLLVRFWAGLG